MNLIEPNIIKTSLGLSTRTKSTKLLYATKLDKLEDRLKMAKIKFAIRLYKNSITRRILLETFKLSEKGPNLFIQIVKHTRRRRNIRTSDCDKRGRRHNRFKYNKA